MYEVILPGIFRGMVVPTDEFLVFKLWVIFVPVKIDPLKMKVKKRRKKKVEAETKKKKKGQKPGKVPVKSIKRMVTRVFKSFTVEKLRVNIDTGDSILNARLVPIFYGLSSRTRTLSVNFQDVNHIELTIRNRIINIIAIAIRTFVFKN